jgi:hypothetical protein|eukprot:COSAG01_NODE_2318_length_7917_cov_44.417242_8_plen_100_part_00
MCALSERLCEGEDASRSLTPRAFGEWLHRYHMGVGTAVLRLPQGLPQPVALRCARVAERASTEWVGGGGCGAQSQRPRQAVDRVRRGGETAARRGAQGF